MIDFPPEADDEVIIEAISHKLYRPIFNTRNKVWRDSTQPKTPTSPFHIFDSLRYTNEGHNEIVELVNVNTNYPDSINYNIKFLRLNTIIVNKKFLNSRNVPDIGSIQIYLYAL